MRLIVVILVVAAAAVAAAVAIGDGGDDPPAAAAPKQAAKPREKVVIRGGPRLPRADCPEGVPGCKAVVGTVVYVERVDPDGDGDLHVVVDAGDVTLLGMTAIDVAPELRPRRDPRVGDRVSAAGPVQKGSYGQSQIHALEFHARRRG